MNKASTRSLSFLLASVIFSAIALRANHTTDSLATVRTSVTDNKAVLVDVRETAEWAKGHIEGAVFLPISALKQGVDAQKLGQQLPKDKIIYTYCVVGKRALAAANILEKHGYQVQALKPGYEELVKAGFNNAK